MSSAPSVYVGSSFEIIIDKEFELSPINGDSIFIQPRLLEEKLINQDSIVVKQKSKLQMGIIIIADDQAINLDSFKISLKANHLFVDSEFYING